MMLSLPIKKIKIQIVHKHQFDSIDWKLSKVKCCSFESVHFWPYVGKPKCFLRGGIFYQFSKICLQFSKRCFLFSATCVQFFANISLLPHNCVLTLKTKCQICIFSVIQPFIFDNFQSKHPVDLKITSNWCNI